MSSTDRKAALACYRERKVAAGIFAIRCAATGAAWVGRAPDLSTIRNRIWFSLRHGGHSHGALQAAWGEHGPDAFVFEIVETLEPGDSPALRDLMLKKRLACWQTALGADRL
jgi:hypothetical protein